MSRPARRLLPLGLVFACFGALQAHAADLTELNLISNLAIRLGRPIEWDSDNARCVGIPEAASLIHKNYRKF